MDIEWLRDLIIIIDGIIMIILMVGFSIVFFRLYRRARDTQKSIQEIVDRIHHVVTSIQNMTDPIQKIITMLRSKHNKREAENEQTRKESSNE